MTASSKLAEFALKAFSQEIPKNVYDVAVLAIIDQYGLQIGGSEFSWSKAIHQYSKKYAGKGGSTVTRYGDALPAVQAAFINGSFAHAQDFDDSHQEAQTHPGSEGSPENLFTLSDVKEKYFKNTTPIIGLDSAEQLYNRLKSFESLESIRNLSANFHNVSMVTSKLDI